MYVALLAGIKNRFNNILLRMSFFFTYCHFKMHNLFVCRMRKRLQKFTMKRKKWNMIGAGLPRLQEVIGRLVPLNIQGTWAGKLAHTFSGSHLVLSMLTLECAVGDVVNHNAMRWIVLKLPKCKIIFIKGWEKNWNHLVKNYVKNYFLHKQYLYFWGAKIAKTIISTIKEWNIVTYNIICTCM